MLKWFSCLHKKLFFSVAAKLILLQNKIITLLYTEKITFKCSIQSIIHGLE